MYKYIIFIPILSTLLISCGSSQEHNFRTLTGGNIVIIGTGLLEPAPQEKVLTTTGQTVTVPEETTEKPGTIKNATGKTDTPIEKSEISSLQTRPSYSVEAVEKIKTLDDMKTLNPSIANLPGKDDPNFIELQKDQMLLSIYIGQIQSPKYIKLREEQADIYQGTEIMSPELNAINNAFIEALSHMTPGESSGSTFSEILEKKNKAMKEFRASKEYTDYIKANQEKITNLNELMKTYWTPEMMELQKDIERLRKGDSETIQ